MINTLRLVERQVGMASLRDPAEARARVLEPGRHPGANGVAFGPCLLISRECASGGSQIARLAADQLGWSVFDAAIVDEIAQSAHVHQALVQSVDEHIRSVWEQTWRELLLDELPDREYLRHLRLVLLTLGHIGRVVIVGRGAQYFLPPACALRARLVAPPELRAQKFAGLENLPLPVARARVKAVDAGRDAFVRKLFKQEAGSPLNYDVVLNTGGFSAAATAGILVDLLRHKPGIRPGQPPTGLTH